VRRALGTGGAVALFALLGPRIAARHSPRTVAQLGVVAVGFGAIVMLATQEWETRTLGGCCFGWRVMVCGRRASPAVRLGAGLAVRASGATRALTTRASLPSRSPKAGSGIVAARDYDRLWCRSPPSSSA
jgi:hypothetical protein